MAGDIASENLFKQALEHSTNAETAQKKISADVKDLCAKVPPALKESDQDMLEHFAKALRAELNAISTSLKDVRVGLNFLKEAEEDEEFLADRQKEVKDLLDSLTALRTTLTHQYESIEDLEKQVKAGLKTDQATKEDFIDEIAKQDSWI